MSPRGNQRNFSSPSLVKRSGLQHLKPVTTSQDKPPSGYSHNIWENPFGTLDPLGPHHQAHPPSHPQDLQYLHHHQFPHIPNHRLPSLEELTGQGDQRMEIYENPSEHYAAVRQLRESDTERER